MIPNPTFTAFRLETVHFSSTTETVSILGHGNPTVPPGSAAVESIPWTIEISWFKYQKKIYYLGIELKLCSITVVSHYSIFSEEAAQEKQLYQEKGDGTHLQTFNSNPDTDFILRFVFWLAFSIMHPSKDHWYLKMNADFKVKNCVLLQLALCRYDRGKRAIIVFDQTDIISGVSSAVANSSIWLPQSHCVYFAPTQHRMSEGQIHQPTPTFS